MSARKLAARSVFKVAIEQAAARQRLDFQANSADPDPTMVLADIAKLSDSASDAVYAIRAAQAVVRAAAAAPP